MVAPKLIRFMSFVTMMLAWPSAITLASTPRMAAPIEKSAPFVVSQVLFKPHASGAPMDTRGGASRGDGVCTTGVESTGKKLSLLLPSSNFGLTVAERPSFFVYLPPTSASAVFFSLKDQQGKVHYQATLPIAMSGSVIQISLPNEVQPLAFHRHYQWSIAVLCTGKLGPDSPYVSGWLQRIALTDGAAVQQIHQGASVEQAAFYGANGVWYDALSILAELRRRQPQNSTLVTTWSSLLESVGLAEVAQEPLL
jgi:hypothetical protein